MSPTAARRPCRTCHTVGCTAHPQGGAWDHHQPRPRLRGRALLRARARLLMEQPFCKLCPRLTTIRDHIVPLAEGGTEDRSNIQGLCDRCHRRKSQAEALRGAQRARGY